MPTPEIDAASTPPQEPEAPAAIAPVWHTIVLVLVIVALSIHGASRFSPAQPSINRLQIYGYTAAMDVGLLAWVLFGLHLKKISLRSLLGSCSWSLRSIAMDLGFAAIFWSASLMVLASLSLTWMEVEARLSHRPSPIHAVEHSTQANQNTPANQTAQTLIPDPERLETLRVLAQLAPANKNEIAAWTLLCLLVGFVEEIVFRGYFQRQFIGWARGGVMLGVLASAVVFGGAHAYQGLRGMVLITVFGALFSLLALYRRSLRAGIFAHAWNDWIAGLALALLKANHIL